MRTFFFIAALALAMATSCTHKLKTGTTETSQESSQASYLDTSKATIVKTVDTTINTPADSVKTALQLAGFPMLDSTYVQSVETPRTSLKLYYNPVRRTLDAVATSKAAAIPVQFNETTTYQAGVSATAGHQAQATVAAVPPPGPKPWQVMIRTAGYAFGFCVVIYLVLIYSTPKTKEDA